MNPLPFVLALPLVAAFAAAAWKGWRGGLAVAGVVVLLACGGFAMVLLAPRSPSAGQDYMHGQQLVYAALFLVVALAGVAIGAVVGLGVRRLALQGRPPMLEVEHPIRKQGTKR
jgi:hypothetical protein